jgi:hypothetical protein
VIDPDNAFTWDNKDNNTIHRVFTVLPPSPDTVAPHVDNFTIDGGAQTTTDLVVNLVASASDPDPSSGINSILFLEYEYSQAANYWVPVNNSGWVPYAQAQAGYDYTLMPSVGMKYIQAWAADNAGNISTYPYAALINYLPPSDSVVAGQGRIYRYTLEAGQQLTVQVQVLSGDPDLYVWAPDYATRPPWVSNQSVGDEEVSFVAPVSGEYQVEVYGYTSATYTLSVHIAGEQEWRHGANATVVHQVNDKPVPTQPMVALQSVPANQVWLPPVEVPQVKVYLPTVMR